MVLSPTSFVSTFQAENVSNAANKVTPADFAMIQGVIDGTNKLRAEQGLPPLKYDASLTAYAQVRTIEESKSVNLDHNRLDGSSWETGLTGYGRSGENLDAGTMNNLPEEAVADWYGSDSHRANILSAAFDSIGVGMVYEPNSKYKYYWTQIFGSNTTRSLYFLDNQPSNNKPLESLVVNQKTIPLVDVPNGDWKTLSANDYTGAVNGYQNSRFGVHQFYDNKRPQFFYQGMQTPSNAMPISGVAQYQGGAVMVQDGRTQTNLTSQFTVDFGNKSLGGGIFRDGNKVVDIQAVIHGNAFSTKPNTSVETQGAFFGEQAEELAGVFRESTQDKADKIGAFGAKR